MCLCGTQAKVSKLDEVEGYVEIQGQSFKIKEILETILTELKLLKHAKLKMLKSTTHFAPLFL